MFRSEASVLGSYYSNVDSLPSPQEDLAQDGGLRPDSLSGYLSGWVRPSRPANGGSNQAAGVRFALPAFFAHATQTSRHKHENDDAAFVERQTEGMVVAGLFDGVTIPRRHHRAGHAVAALVRERLRALLVEVDGRPPIIEEALATALEDGVACLDSLGGGAATTATVVVAAPARNGEWRVHVINAGNSRATLFLPDGTAAPITRLKPAGTAFAAINTLTAGYRYRREASKVTVAAGTIVLLTSDGVHDHVPDSAIWIELGGAVERALASGRAQGAVEGLARQFVENVVQQGVAAQDVAQRPDDTTAMALVLGDPTAALETKFIR